MRTDCNRVGWLMIWAATLLMSRVVEAEERSLARVAFWLPPERMAEFATVYEEKVVPLLHQRGLVASSKTGRATTDSVFSRLFELESPTSWREVNEAMSTDPAWQNLLKELGNSFGAAGSDSLMRSDFRLYSSPAGPGKSQAAGPGRTMEAGPGFPQELAGSGQTVLAGPGQTMPAGPGKTVLAGAGTTTPVKPRQPVRAGAGFRQELWQIFGVQDGLPGAEVSTILQDREGNIWFGTHSGGDGVGRFDGAHFTYLTTADGLPRSWVISIMEDRQGQIWIGTGVGVSRYDGTHITNFTTADGLPTGWVGTMLEDHHGNLWFGTDEGVSRYDGTHITTFTTADGLPNSWVGTMLEDRHGNLWFGSCESRLSPSPGGAVSRYDGTHFTTFTADDGLASDGVCSFLEDRDGNLWLGTNAGVSRYDGSHFTNFTAEDGLDGHVWAMAEDRQGNLWFGGKGVKRYDGVHVASFTTKDALEHGGVLSIRVDREGTVWVGTRGGGISRFDGHHFTTFTIRDGLPGSDAVGDIIEDQRGDLWFGTWGGGLGRYDGNHFTTFTTANGLPHLWVGSMLQDRKGQLWFRCGYPAGRICRYDGKEFVTFGRGSPGFKDRQGDLWFGRREGLSRYDGTHFTTFSTADGFPRNDPNNGVSAVLEDRHGNFWFGREDGEVSRYDGAEFTTFTAADGLPQSPSSVMDIVEDRQGNLWFGTRGGVIRYDGKQFVTFTISDGLVSNDVWSVFEDRRGHFWFGTRGGGVARFDGMLFQSLTRKDGLANNVVRTIHQDADGAIWMATGGGLVRYRPAVIPPAIRVTEVVADRSYGPVSELSLPSSQQFATFQFQGRSMITSVDDMAYVYRLQGHDDQWRPTRATQVEYTDLPRGDYVFEVKAVDRDLNYSEPAHVAVKIHLPYERIGWGSALSLAAILIVGLGVRLVRKDRKLQVSNKALTAANHAKSLFLANMSHEIRTPMNAILGYAQILRRSSDLPPDHRHAVQTIQQSGDHLLNLINDVLDISKIEAGRMELTPADFDLQALLETLGVMFELQCQEKGLEWRLEGVGAENLPVNGDEDKLRQVLINLLGNAVKFTQAGEVVLRLDTQPDDHYRFEVVDTGPGLARGDQKTLFEAFQQGAAGSQQGGTGLGLTIVQRQLELMGGALEVESTVGSGSTFGFTICLPPAQGKVRAEAQGAWSQVRSLAAGYTVRALAADDVPANRDILRSMLAGIGVEIEVAENGQQALDRLQDFRADIVFLDIRMPVLGGIETLEQMRQRGHEMKVVAISASVLEHERQEYLAAGFDEFIDKPFRFEQICACLATHLGVEYEYAEPVEEAAVPDETDWTQVELSADLHARLQEAAEVYGVTEMEEYLTEMEGLGEDQKRLASHLRSLKQRQDMNAILSILGDVHHG